MVRKLCWVAVLCLMWGVSAIAEEDDAAALAARLEPLQSLRAHFEQTVRDERGEILQQGSGQMLVQRPNRLRWETEQPFRYLVVTDGEVLWRYDADLEQANREPFRGELADAPGLILGGDPERIAAQYRVRADGDRFVLEPRSDEALFRRLTLVWRDAALHRMTLVDRLDQTTEIVFSDLQRNPELAPSTFGFEPPADADVIIHE